MLDHAKQAQLRAVFPPMPRRLSPNMVTVVAVATALAVDVLASVHLAGLSTTSADLTYTMRRVRDMLAVCTGTERVQIRLAVEQRLDKPYKKFNDRDRVAAIDLVIDELVRSGCVKLAARPAPAF